MTDSDLTRLLPEAINHDLVAGSIFAEKFEILGKLGLGGMSDVYKARQLHMDRIVALKIMRPNFSSSITSRKRFQREAQALCALKHENIVKAISFGAHGPDCFIAMDYIEGIPVSQLVQERGRLPLEQAIQVIIDACSGLAHAHSKGIVHRDIKPSNIMLVQESGRTKAQLVDFGLAKLLDGDPSDQKLTQTNHLIGTPLYMSPEQCANGVLDVRSDIYSLGCVFYEMLSGKPPFEGESPYAIMYGHLHEVAPALPPDTPPWLQDVVFKMIQRGPENRYQEASDVVRVLVNQHDSGPVAAPPARVAGYSTARKKLLDKLFLIVPFSLLLAGTALYIIDHNPLAGEDRKGRSDEPGDNYAYFVKAGQHLTNKWADALEKKPSVGAADPNYSRAIAYYKKAYDMLVEDKNLVQMASVQWTCGERLWEAGRKSGIYGESFCCLSIEKQLEAARSELPERTDWTLEALLTAEDNLTKFQTRYGRNSRTALGLQRRVYADLATEYMRLHDMKNCERSLRKWLEASVVDDIERLQVTIHLSHVADLTSSERTRLLNQAFVLSGKLAVSPATYLSSVDTLIDCCVTLKGAFGSSSPSKAIQCLKNAITISRKKYGEQSAETLKLQVGLADYYMDQRKFKAAKAVYIQILPLFLDNDNELPMEHIHCLEILSRLSETAGHLNEAERYLLKALRLNQGPSTNQFLVGKEKTASWLFTVASYAVMAKRPQEARPKISEALLLLQGTTGLHSSLMRSQAYNLQGYSLRASNRKQAKVYYLKALANEKLSNEVSFQSALTAQELSSIAESEGNLKLALSYMEEAARISHKVAPKDLQAAAVYDYHILRLRTALR